LKKQETASTFVFGPSQAKINQVINNVMRTKDTDTLIQPKTKKVIQDKENSSQVQKEQTHKNPFAFDIEKTDKVNQTTFKIDSSIIILDDVEISQKDMKQLDPNTIESINVLKGKSAISAYGNKGKNGMIVIKLKDKLIKTPKFGYIKGTIYH